MTKLTFIRIATALCLAVASFSAFAVQRTFVASYGLDTNPCNLLAPCRGFAAALAVTDANGEVIVLDSAGYGIVNIAQAVSIIAPPGVYAGISVFGGQDGVTVSAGVNDKVVLRGLTVNGQGGNRGIRVVSGLSVHIEDCVVSNMGDTGIRIEGGSAVHVTRSALRSNLLNGALTLSGATTEVFVSDTLITGGTLGVTQTGGFLTLDRVRLEDNIGTSIEVAASSPDARLLVRDTLASGSNAAGLFVSAAVGRQARVVVERSSLFRNAIGIVNPSANPPAAAGTVTLTVVDSAISENGAEGISVSGPTTVAMVTGSTVTRNGATGFFQSGTAVFRSYQNNTLGENNAGGVQTAGTITSVPTQ